MQELFFKRVCSSVCLSVYLCVYPSHFLLQICKMMKILGKSTHKSQRKRRFLHFVRRNGYLSENLGHLEREIPTFPHIDSERDILTHVLTHTYSYTHTYTHGPIHIDTHSTHRHTYTLTHTRIW